MLNSLQFGQSLERHAAHSIKVDNLFQSISFLGKRGALVSDLYTILPTKIAQEVVVLDIGTNDIVQGVPVKTIVDNITKLLKIVLSLGPQVVCLLSVIPRASGLRQLTEESFLIKAAALEQALKQVIVAMPQVLYCKQKGFYEFETGNVKSSLSPYSWSRDGIHANKPPHGKKKYMNALRTALVRCEKGLRGSEYLFPKNLLG